jgi:uncharacterized membrane protein
MSSAVYRVLIGIGLTACASYFLDSTSGQRRRTMVRDRVKDAAAAVSKGTRSAGHTVADRAQWLTGRAKSATARAKSAFAQDTTSDAAVARRVRTAVRHAASRPAVIGVVSHEGRIILHGDVLPHEHEQVVHAVRGVSGVINVTDHLTERGGIEEPHAPRGFDLRQEHWSPAARVLLGSMGSALVAAAIRQRSPLAVLGAVVAVPLLLRSVTNKPLKRLGRGHGVIDVRKTILVKAPLDRVFALLEDYENFPAFMRNVRKVIRHEDGTSHWVVAGPAEAPVEWDSVTTVRQPNEILAWQSVPGSRIEHSGVIRFEAIGADQTRVDIRMSYSPPAGALGHVVARLCGADPDTELEEDLTRMKRFVETWKSVADAGRPFRDVRRETTGADGAAPDRKRHAAPVTAEEGNSRMIAS